jgi:hypothetical protein
VSKAVAFGGVRLSLPPGWEDTTKDVESREKPFTLTKSDGVGALQFTIALYRRGPKPDLSSATLLNMAEEFGEKHSLGAPTDQVTEDGSLAIAAVSYRNGGDFIRVWYVSDGWSVTTITYVSADGVEHREVDECEDIVRSIRFEDSRVRE